MSEFIECPTPCTTVRKCVKVFGDVSFIYVLLVQLALFLPARVAIITMQMVCHACVAAYVGKDFPSSGAAFASIRSRMLVVLANMLLKVNFFANRAKHANICSCKPFFLPQSETNYENEVDILRCSADCSFFRCALSDGWEYY